VKGRHAGQLALTTAEELRQVTRDAHAATKDLRAAMQEARKMAADASEAALNDIGHSLKIASEVIQERMGEFSETLSERMPICIRCPRCTAVLALLSEPGANHCCPDCGARFIFRAQLRDQAILGLRKNPQDPPGMPVTGAEQAGSGHAEPGPG
jgi:predicted RNA-binding Zn-ribbon protein involved in translation (DUF1610 family)